MAGQLLGVALIVLGVLIAIFGDRKMGREGGLVLRLFSMPSLNAKIVKWAVALVCVGLGGALVVPGDGL